MVATIVISCLLVALVVWIIYRMIKNSKAGQGHCAGCAYNENCGAAKYFSNRTGCNGSDRTIEST